MDQLGAFLPLILLGAIFYFMLIRPQQRKVRQQRNLVDNLHEGDEVILGSGIYGRIKRLGEQDLDLEIASGTTVKVLKAAVYRNQTSESSQLQERGEGKAT